MKKVLVVHPQFEGLGGAEMVSLRIMEWIGRTLDAEITLLTLVPVNLQALTSSGISQSTVRKISPSAINLPRFLRKSSMNLHLLRLAFLHRRAREIASGYELCISTYNELDFGKKGIQYIHHPSFADRSVLEELDVLGGQSPILRVPPANLVYRKLVESTAGYSVDGFRRNLTLVNSGFMKEIVGRVYGVVSEVVYPAVLSDDWFDGGVRWDDRDFRFVSVGRIAPDKKLTHLLDWYTQLHREFPAAEYVIAGWSSDEAYERSVLTAARQRGIPLRILRNVPKQELRSLLRTSKFYVHCKMNEHFGISIVEAAASGCVTLVHHSGSAEEIVKTPLLMFEDGRDLARKVKYLLDTSVHDKILIDLRNYTKEFTHERFYSQLNRYVLPTVLEMKG